MLIWCKWCSTFDIQSEGISSSLIISQCIYIMAQPIEPGRWVWYISTK